MVRSRSVPSPDGGGAMTFMMFTLRGDGATMQQGFRTMSETIERVSPGSRIRPAQGEAAQGLPAPEDPTTDVELGTTESLDGTAVSPIATTNDSTPKGPKKPPRSPVVLPDLDCKGGDPPLAELFAKHSVEGTTKRYLVIADWLKKNKQIDEVSMDHIHTCFRAMGWNTPDDAGSPLRSMLRAGWFGKGSKRGFFKINHIGEGEVMKMFGGMQ